MNTKLSMLVGCTVPPIGDFIADITMTDLHIHEPISALSSNSRGRKRQMTVGFKILASSGSIERARQFGPPALDTSCIWKGI